MKIKDDLIQKIRNTPEYKVWKALKNRKFGGMCSNCELRGDWIQIHHKKHLTTILKEFNITSLQEAKDCGELWDINNGDCLCSICHYGVHS